MNTETENHIDELLKHSGLFSSEDLLQKNKEQLNFSNENILITGASGTIGSGLVNQLVRCKFKKLILIDNAESPLYELIKSLEFEEKSNIHFKLIDITNKESLQHVFAEHKPSIVFHAAAYKHVPLMETHAICAVNTNVFGTKLLADLSYEYKTKKFIFISTDKAVNPINVMGISKKIAENYLHYLNTKNNTRFIITRFGNIFGSNGSVVPLLKKQIEFEQPLTITDKLMSRYFISKQKACGLILELAKNNNYNNNAYTFNMGKPILISDIIERLIIKCGKQKNNLKIKVTGLRPGEKIHEELKSNDEMLIPTDNDGILIIKQHGTPETNEINFNRLKKITPKTSNKEIKSILKSYL
ncbi:SDR family NAD(P)-dependent oxidoreductase [Algibacter sp. R77976]|uniref:SDR family NAD(P)-dependent oxidoreductase n=1 Tax=Algibacter sp. R77976 TaxID=3093873 RepID=UPI0037CA03D3